MILKSLNKICCITKSKQKLSSIYQFIVEIKQNLEVTPIFDSPHLQNHHSNFWLRVSMQKISLFHLIIFEKQSETSQPGFTGTKLTIETLNKV